VHDAAWREDLQQELLTFIEGNTRLMLAGGEEAALTLQAAQQADAGREAAATPAPADPVLAEALTAPSIAGAPGRLEEARIEVPLSPTVAPAPLSAQPGEAAAPPRSSAPDQDSQDGHDAEPRDIEQKGEPLQARGWIRARASARLNGVRAANRLPSRMGSAEQSNTSIRYGDEFILKLFRRLEPGENPDVEVGRFLTEVARFPSIPTFFGEISLAETSGEKTTLAMLQGLVTEASDGWEWFLEEIAEMLTRVGEISPPDALPGSSFFRDPPPLSESLRPFSHSLDAAALLGRRTAELHLALATRTDNPAFRSESLREEDLAREAERIEVQLKCAFDALRPQLSRLDESTSDAAALLLSRRAELAARAHAVASLAAGGQRIRIHGDFHLGQTLRTRGTVKNAQTPQANGGGDFVFLDFEGEPARSLSERRQKHSPLKDVAGMLRSFSYAAHFALNRFFESLGEKTNASPKETLGKWAQAWQNEASARFLHAYRVAIGANSELLPPLESAQVLLDAYLLEKAVYELVYELNNRPAWLGIPISGILSL
jgi:maltose alpha-D-glucosyltransferase / alpha-amylase